MRDLSNENATLVQSKPDYYNNLLCGAPKDTTRKLDRKG